MKNMIYKMALMLLVLSGIILPSCKKGFEELNIDPINVPTTTPEKLLAPAIRSTLAANLSRNRSFNNELMQVTVSISDADYKIFRYEFRSTVSDYLWNSWYVQLTNFKDIDTLARREDNFNRSYQGISLICQSWIYSMLTDTYGDIPYFESNQGRDKLLEPAFDKQKDIYEDMFKKLEEANILLSSGDAISDINDPVYHGDVSKWRKFGNSLYLRLLLRVSGKAEVAANCIAKIKEIAENPATYPIMTSNDDTATVLWTGGDDTNDPYTSPLVSVRVQDFRAASLGSFFIDHIRDWNHPALVSTYAVGGVNKWGIAQAPTGGYGGVPSGYAVGSGFTKQSYFYSSDQKVSNVLVADRSLQLSPLTGIIMNYAEVQFILAEAVVKGWISGDAGTYYNEGVYSAIAYWVPAFEKSDLAEYMTNADIEWIPLNLDDAMEKIHLQKYYALFMVDMEQWFEYRRTGHPVLPKGDGLRNNGVMPARMPYPVYVQSANPTNYKKAVAEQGPDVLSTNVWWQKP